MGKKIKRGWVDWIILCLLKIYHSYAMAKRSVGIAALAVGVASRREGIANLGLGKN